MTLVALPACSNHRICMLQQQATAFGSAHAAPAAAAPYTRGPGLAAILVTHPQAKPHAQAKPYPQAKPVPGLAAQAAGNRRRHVVSMAVARRGSRKQFR